MVFTSRNLKLIAWTFYMKFSEGRCWDAHRKAHKKNTAAGQFNIGL